MGFALIKCAGEFSISRSTLSQPIIPVSPISPDSISGLSLWLTAGSGITTSGSLVTGWADQSGNGNDAYILNSGEEPVFVSSAINGLPAISFDGATQIMQIDDSSSLDIAALSVFIVTAKDGNGAGNDVIFIKNGDTTSDSAVYGLVAKSFQNWMASYDAGGGWSDKDSYFTINNNTNFHIIGYKIDNSTSFSFQDNSAPNNLSATGTIPTTDGSIQIGGYNQSFDNPSGEFFYGKIAEFIIYDNAISESNRLGLFSYLNNKYAIY